MREILIPAVTAAIGFALANWQNILGWFNKSARDEISLYNELQNALKAARQDVLQLYKIIDEMEAQNIVLKSENLILKGERDAFKALADTARQKLDETLQYVAQLEKKIEEGFRDNPRKKK